MISSNEGQLFLSFVAFLDDLSMDIMLYLT